MINNYKYHFIPFILADANRHFLVYSGSKKTVNVARLALIFFSPRFAPVFLCRLAHAAYNIGLGPLGKIVSLFNFLIFGIEISIQCKIGKGLLLPHTHGTVIGASYIGENVTIFQGVTLGAKELDVDYTSGSRPIIGSNTTIGAGAKILGGISVGSNACIGANSVVIVDVPDDVIAAGIPATIVKQIIK